MNYILDTDFLIGDMVNPKVEKEYHQTVIGYGLEAFDPAGQVTSYTLICSDADSNQKAYRPIEVEKVPEWEKK